MSLHARITKIDIERFQVDLTTKSSDLKDESGQWKLERDIYYDYIVEMEDIKKAEEKFKKKNEKSLCLSKEMKLIHFH